MLLMLRKISVIFPRNKPPWFSNREKKNGTWVFGENLQTSKKITIHVLQVKGFGVWHLCHENPQDESAGSDPRRLGHQCTSEECSCNETCSNLLSPICVEKSPRNRATPSQDLHLFKDPGISLSSLILTSYLQKKKHRFSLKVRLLKIFTHLTSISPPAEMTNCCTCRWIRNSYPRPKAPWEPRNLDGSSSIRGYPWLTAMKNVTIWRCPKGKTWNPTDEILRFKDHQIGFVYVTP